MPMSALTHEDRCIINGLQSGFPLVSHPMAHVAYTLGMEETTLRERLAALLHTGFLSRFGPMYNPEAMGGALLLAAMRVDAVSFESVVRLLDELPTVSQNYARNHPLNMWFVVAAESHDEVEETLATIERQTGCQVLRLPKQQEYHIGFQLVLRDDGHVDTCRHTDTPVIRPVSPVTLTPQRRSIIAATQDGLPLVSRPWWAVAQQLNMAEEALRQEMETMLACGIIRRIGVVPNHYRLGLTANAMTVWDVPDYRIDTLGVQVGALPFVTHAYRRPRIPPAWPYNLFAMVHGSTRAIVEERIATMQQQMPEIPHATLYSQRILKKRGFRCSV
jgi:DNA-binding Lrp family transcriptional regulator